MMTCVHTSESPRVSGVHANEIKDKGLVVDGKV